MSKSRKLYRDVVNQKIAGVCAGLSDYFDIDVTLIRVIWVIFLFCGGGGLIAYIIMAIVVDPKNVVLEREAAKNKTVENDDDPFAKYDKK